MIFTWPWRLWRRAFAHERTASDELARSQVLMEEASRALAPLREIQQRNQFSDMIRAALQTGPTDGALQRGTP